MFTMTVLTVGKLKEKFYLEAAAEYAKRLSGFCELRMIELPECRLPDSPAPAQIAAGLEREADAILAKLPKNSWFCVLTPEGRILSSEDFAAVLANTKQTGRSSACFLIGSSFGIAARVKARADLLLSMGKMTFPHHLARIMLLEQLYRAESIQAGTRYHK